LAIIRIDINGNVNIGVFAVATDKFVLVRFDAEEKIVESLERTLDVPVIKAKIGDSTLIGVLVSANSKGILVPYYASDDEIRQLHEKLGGDVNIERLPSKLTALGNLILTNDKHAIVHPEFDFKAIRIIADVLDVEVLRRENYTIPLVGSCGVATNKGILLNPMFSDEEIEWISSIFKVPIGIGTVNHGMPFVGAGMIANSKGAAVGLNTTYHEMVRISETLGV